MRWATCTFIALGLTSLSALAMAGTNDPNQESVSVIRAGSGPSSEGSPDNFTGRVRVQGRFQRESPARVGGATVMFEPSARTAWHTHPLGQTLIVLQGHGFVQEWQHSARAIGPGDVIWIPPGTKHWHGASAAEPMTHVAIAETRSNRSVTWMEKVSDTQYADAVSLGNGTP